MKQSAGSIMCILMLMTREEFVKFSTLFTYAHILIFQLHLYICPTLLRTVQNTVLYLILSMLCITQIFGLALQKHIIKYSERIFDSAVCQEFCVHFLRLLSKVISVDIGTYEKDELFTVRLGLPYYNFDPFPR